MTKGKLSLGGLLLIGAGLGSCDSEDNLHLIGYDFNDGKKVELYRNFGNTKEKLILYDSSKNVKMEIFNYDFSTERQIEKIGNHGKDCVILPNDDFFSKISPLEFTKRDGMKVKEGSKIWRDYHKSVWKNLNVADSVYNHLKKNCFFRPAL